MRVESPPQYKIFFVRVGYADAMVAVSQEKFEDLVHVDASGISEAEH